MGGKQGRRGTSLPRSRLTLLSANSPWQTRRVKIYTKTGDDGTTGLFGGGRVAKSSSRVEAYGTVDEVNSVIGVARAGGLAAEIDDVLAQVQVDLFTVGAELACVPGKESKLKMDLISSADAERLERAIDE